MLITLVRHTHGIVSIFVVLLVVFCSPAIAKEKMIWLQQDAVPYFITSGKYKGQGLFELVQKIIQQKMPEYEHEGATLPQKRLFREFKTNKKVCAVAVVRTPEREKYMYFTVPTFFLVPHRITILKENWKLFNKRKEVSLDKLLEDTSLTLGITAGRSYGNVIDPILIKYKGQQNILMRHGSLYEDLFRMLLLGRVSYIIGYPTEMIYYTKKFKVGDKVMNLAIGENEDYIFGVAGLPKNKWGKETAEKINAIILKERETSVYRNAMESWQDIGVDDITFRKDYDNIFLKKIE